MSGASVRANGRARDLVLQSVFLAMIDHSALVTLLMNFYCLLIRLFVHLWISSVHTWEVSTKEYLGRTRCIHLHIELNSLTD